MAAISPDGLSLAYFDALPDGRTVLKIRSMNSGETSDFPAAEMAQAGYVFWSPDSKAIYFGSRRFLKRLELARGTLQTICECSPNSGTVNQDGVILLGGPPTRPGIVRVSTSG